MYKLRATSAATTMSHGNGVIGVWKIGAMVWINYLAYCFLGYQWHITKYYEYCFVVLEELVQVLLMCSFPPCSWDCISRHHPLGTALIVHHAVTRNSTA